MTSVARLPETNSPTVSRRPRSQQQLLAARQRLTLKRLRGHTDHAGWGRQLGLGDGNSNAAATKANASMGSPVCSDLVNTMLAFPIGYEPSDVIATKESWLDILMFQASIMLVQYRESGITSESDRIILARTGAGRSECRSAQSVWQ